MSPMYRRSALMADCDECGRTFDPVHGGVCPRCKRLLCRRHLYGSGLRRVLAYFGVQTDCVRCKRGEQPESSPR